MKEIVKSFSSLQMDLQHVGSLPLDAKIHKIKIEKSKLKIIYKVESKF
jgi:hypothetical protein